MCDALVNAMRCYCDEQHDWLKMREEWIPYYRYYSDTFDNCVCGQQVKEMCQIQHKRTKKVLFVGNKCIDQFSKTALCSNCNIYPLEKNTHIACALCRRKDTRPSGDLLFGKYKGMSYADVFSKDRDYCSWVLEKVDFSDEHFREFLKRKYYEIKGRPYQDPKLLDRFFKR
jgi:hypothetical protein